MDAERTEVKMHRGTYPDHGLLDSMTLGIAVKQLINGTFRYVGWNCHCEAYFNWSRDQVIGKSDFELYSDLKAQALHDLDMAAVHDAACSTTEEPLLHDTLGPIIVRIRRTPEVSDDGECTTLYYLIDDITQAEQDRFSEAQIALMTKEDPTPILRFSPKGNLLFNNPAAEKLIKRVAKENDSEFGTLWLDKIEACYTNKYPNKTEFTIGKRTYKLTFCPSTEFASVNVYVNDITYRKIAERKLLERNIDLAKLNKEALVREKKMLRSDDAIRLKNERLFELNKQLRDHHEQLLQSEKMASVGQLAAGVAHEINNPIGFVKSNIGTLEEYIETFCTLLKEYERLESSSTDSDCLNRIQTIKDKEDLDYLMDDVQTLLSESIEGISRVQEIVQNLKSFARVDEADQKEANINECIESTLKVVSNELKYTCTVTKDLGEVPFILCYPGQLNQVFMNLLVNASHSIKDKGEITIRTGVEGDKVMIEIADTGCGIESKHLAKLFDPFFTTKEVGKGTGLGLSISHGIIEKHGGKISVDSTVGKGTTFKIQLPIRTAEK